MLNFLKSVFSFILIISLIISCQNDNSKTSVSNKSTKKFEEIHSDFSGLSFNNNIKETAQINYFNYVYLYNGSGVGIGDINNDGLSDIYFTSTMGKDKLFLNKGELTFQDISASSGIDQFDGHKTGVTMVDINLDGWLDIYVCRSGWSKNAKDLSNILYINNQDGTFTEKAKEYGLADESYSVQATFIDYDSDGDLDMYLANHPSTFKKKLDEMIHLVKNPNYLDSDHFYRNNGDGTFDEIGQEIGIFNYGYGLGLAAADFNGDNLTDIYVSNDFDTPDYYYVNQGDGSFKESLEEYFPHHSYFSMGNDVVDINNDSHFDLFVVEMLSEQNVRQKTNMAPMDMNRFKHMISNGLKYQYMRNVFQLNNGNGHFSDIANYSGIDKTDWSWGALFGDYDNDGDNDLVVANGYLRDTQDKDFSSKSNKLAKSSDNKLTFEQAYSLLQSTPIQNYAFEYKGDLKFKNVSQEWGFDNEGFSNGVAYGDLDNDGDLDIVVNNINQEASLYRNTTDDKNFIQFKIKGTEYNPNGLNIKINLFTDSGVQYKSHQVSRGFQSSCDHIVHFGLKQKTKIDSVVVTWSPNEKTTYKDITKGQLNILAYKKKKIQPLQATKENQLFKPTENLIQPHQDNYYDDFINEILLPHQLSQLGPSLAIADINNDGLDDIYIGGAHGYSGNLYFQNSNGSFHKSFQPSFDKDKDFEDVSALFLDFDQDDDLDLVVSSGSNEFAEKTSLMSPRIYVNNGKGSFQKGQNILPEINAGGGALAAGDMDNDGDMDLFIGGRVNPSNYPVSPKSFLLENIDGVFHDQTSTFPEIQESGMITSAVWTDYNNDKLLDLILVGEWTDIMFFKNTEKGFLRDNEVLQSKNVGWWNVIKAVDLDNDGDEDYLVGNLGQNYKYKATNDKPFEIYSGDFDENGKRDIVVGYYYGDNLYPVRGLQCSSEQISDIKKKFPTYKEFGDASLHEIYGDKLDESLNYKANNFNSIIIRNNEGQMEIENLPYQAQLAPIQDFIIHDFDKDNDLDIALAGNWFVSEIETPRADSGTGLILLNSENKYEALPTYQSGFFANGDVRKIGLVKGKNNIRIIVANNNGPVQSFVKN